MLESTSKIVRELVAASKAPDAVITGLTGQYNPVWENNDSSINSEREVNEPLVCKMGVKWKIQSLLSSSSQPPPLNAIRGYN